ncbi:MAG TPA: poly(R)-hydroxyalkanoic acid synthase subunit PhaE [Steroidobacteraceae bacterium]|nr:poly(R)-hydroxyalkanoic acid synthase subunit PhaE [Steroidobacteraceae bacterium]
MQNPFAASPLSPDAAFAAAAERFFELLKTFGMQAAGGASHAPDWSAVAGALAQQFEQWLAASPALGASLAASAGFPGAGAPGTFGPVPLGMAAAPGGEGGSPWELLVRLAQLQGQLAGHWSEIARSSAEKFITRLGAGGGPAGELTSEGALQLYELWVDCAEEAYARTVRTEEFCKLQAQLANTSTALLLAQRRQADALARAWGLPTREEADALQRQIRELREQVAARDAAAPAAKERAEPARGARAGDQSSAKRRPGKGAKRTRRGRRPRA